MHHTLIEMLMTLLIMACAFMSAVFIAHQKQGQTFIASFDKAIAYGSYLFVIGCCLSTATYFA